MKCKCCGKETTDETDVCPECEERLAAAKV